jgi:hypothetical protein
MKLEIFSIYDAKASAYITPFFLPNEAMALRAIKAAGSDPNHMFGKHGDDYSVYRLGTFDDESADMLLEAQPQFIGVVAQIVKEYDIRTIEPKDYHAKTG